eukprot:11090187-Alexandrium_andersonii.AAC.1
MGGEGLCGQGLLKAGPHQRRHRGQAGRRLRPRRGGHPDATAHSRHCCGVSFSKNSYCVNVWSRRVHVPVSAQ